MLGKAAQLSAVLWEFPTLAPSRFDLNAFAISINGVEPFGARVIPSVFIKTYGCQMNERDCHTQIISPSVAHHGAERMRQKLFVPGLSVFVKTSVPSGAVRFVI